ncbi:MAG: GntR family transcriptional regulator [Actinomycetes bacterium]
MRIAVRETKHLQLKDMVYENVKQDIVDLVLPPGTHLREADLAERYEVSKTPVREALSRLAQENLIDLHAYRGAIVSTYSRTDLMEIYQLREILEGACAREAAISIGADDLSELGRVVRVSKQALEASQIEELTRLLEAFDEILYRQSTNRRILELVRTLDAHLRRIGKLTVRIPGRLDKSVFQHAEIFEAIGRRNAADAEALMREHVASVLADQLASYDEDAMAMPTSAIGELR